MLICLSQIHFLGEYIVSENITILNVIVSVIWKTVICLQIIKIKHDKESASFQRAMNSGLDNKNALH